MIVVRVDHCDINGLAVVITIDFEIHQECYVHQHAMSRTSSLCRCGLKVLEDFPRYLPQKVVWFGKTRTMRTMDEIYVFFTFVDSQSGGRNNSLARISNIVHIKTNCLLCLLWLSCIIPRPSSVSGSAIITLIRKKL